MSDGLFAKGGPGGSAADPIYTYVTVLPSVTIAAMPNVTLNQPITTTPYPRAASLLTEVRIDVAASGNNVIIAAVPDQVIRIFRMLCVFAAADSCYFRDGAAGIALTGTMTVTQGGSIVLDFDGEPWFTTTAGSAFVLNMTTGVQASGRLYYTQG